MMTRRLAMIYTVQSATEFCKLESVYVAPGGVLDAVRARCGYRGCFVDPFSQFRGNCAHFDGPRHPQSACVPHFCFCNVFLRPRKLPTPVAHFCPVLYPKRAV